MSTVPYDKIYHVRFFLLYRAIPASSFVISPLWGSDIWHGRISYNSFSFNFIQCAMVSTNAEASHWSELYQPAAVGIRLVRVPSTTVCIGTGILTEPPSVVYRIRSWPWHKPLHRHILSVGRRTEAHTRGSGTVMYTMYNYGFPSLACWTAMCKETSKWCHSTKWKH